jgi:putative flavoprotein involved in K+ transport
MGTQFMRRRKSALIDGAGDDARDLCTHLASYLDNRLCADQSLIQIHKRSP